MFDAASTMLTASYVARGGSNAVQEHGLGYRKSEPENFHRFGSRELDGYLRRAHSQFCKEPPLGIHRAGSGSCRLERGPVAVYFVGFDGPRDPLSEVHALS